MTIATLNNRVSYAGDGVTLTFPYPFEIFLNTDLQVYDIVNATGVATLRVLTTDYTVSGAGAPSGGNVVMVVAPASGHTLLIVRVEPMTQDRALPSNDKFPQTVVEAALDKLTMLIQQLNEVDQRALKLSLTSLFANLTMPDPVASKFLRWNVGLTGLENADIVTSGAISIPVPVNQGGTGSTTAAGARTGLGAAQQFTPQVVTYAATIQYDAATGDYFETTLTGPLTLSTPLNPSDGQRMLIRLRQDGTGGRVLTMTSAFRFGTDLPQSAVVLSTAPAKTDYIGVTYNGTDSKWDVIAFIKGF